MTANMYIKTETNITAPIIDKLIVHWISGLSLHYIGFRLLVSQ